MTFIRAPPELSGALCDWMVQCLLFSHAFEQAGKWPSRASTTLFFEVRGGSPVPFRSPCCLVSDGVSASKFLFFNSGEER